MTELPPHSIDIHFQRIKYFEIKRALLVRQLKSSWQLLGQPKNKWDPVLASLHLVIALKPKSRRRLIEEHQTLFFKVLFLFFSETCAILTLSQFL
jgi:hypothetical protein